MIRLRFVNGRGLTIPSSDSDTVADIKAKICAADSETSLHALKLVHKTRILADDEKLSSLNLCERSGIIVQTRTFLPEVMPKVEEVPEATASPKYFERKIVSRTPVDLEEMINGIQALVDKGFDEESAGIAMRQAKMDVREAERILKTQGGTVPKGSWEQARESARQAILDTLYQNALPGFVRDWPEPARHDLFRQMGFDYKKWVAFKGLEGHPILASGPIERLMKFAGNLPRDTVIDVFEDVNHDEARAAALLKELSGYSEPQGAGVGHGTVGGGNFSGGFSGLSGSVPPVRPGSTGGFSGLSGSMPPTGPGSTGGFSGLPSSVSPTGPGNTSAGVSTTQYPGNSSRPGGPSKAGAGLYGLRGAIPRPGHKPNFTGLL